VRDCNIFSHVPSTRVARSRITWPLAARAQQRLVIGCLRSSVFGHRSSVRLATVHESVRRHIAAQSQCGGMSAAGESRLCIVIAACAGGSAHRRAGRRDRCAAAAGPCAGRGANRRRSAVGFTRSEDRWPPLARRLRGTSAATPCPGVGYFRGAGQVGECPVHEKQPRQRGRVCIPARRATSGGASV